MNKPYPGSHKKDALGQLAAQSVKVLGIAQEGRNLLAAPASLALFCATRSHFLDAASAQSDKSGPIAAPLQSGGPVAAAVVLESLHRGGGGGMEASRRRQR